MNYLVAVLPDRIQAEAAYLALEKANFSMETVSILGRGYKSADEFGLLNPQQPARQQMSLMAYWLIPFGFFSGATFSVISHLQTFAWAGEWGNHLIAGLLGAASGALGSFIVGGGVGLASGGGDALLYRNRLEAGQYLIIVQGSESVIQASAPILREFAPVKSY
jgi:hypothetical protein